MKGDGNDAIHGDGQGRLKNTEAGALPDEEAPDRDEGKYNEEAGEGRGHAGGRRAPAELEGAPRVKFSGDKRTRDQLGPSHEAKDLVAGFWTVFNVKSKDEAIEWVKRCPNPTGAEGEIEIRQIFVGGGLRSRADPQSCGRRRSACGAQTGGKR
jgi:hypothetical protein